MNQRLYSWVVLGLLVAAPIIAGCDDMGNPNDVTNRQEQQRMNRSVPGPTELPPGLGDDLPARPQPIANH